MALAPTNSEHALQIQAGTLGRRSGHAFEDAIAGNINRATYPIAFPHVVNEHLSTGDPAYSLLGYVASTFQCTTIENATALSTGALATSEEGQKWLEVNGVPCGAARVT